MRRAAGRGYRAAMTLVADPMDRTLLPYRHLRWRSTVVALIAAAGPTCGVSIWMALQGGHLAPALALTAAIVVSAAVLTWRVTASRIVLEPDGLRTWTPRHHDVHVSRGRITRAVVRSVHSPDGRKVVRHLFLLDSQDQTVHRMCDRWWTDEQIGRVARHFEVPVEALPEAVHLSELRRTVRQQLQWDERHPLLARTAIALGGATACLVVGWLATASI